ASRRAADPIGRATATAGAAAATGVHATAATTDDHHKLYVAWQHAQLHKHVTHPVAFDRHWAKIKNPHAPAVRGVKASWSAALAIWIFAKGVSHRGPSLRSFTHAIEHVPRHCRRHRYPARIKAGRLRPPTHNGGGDSGPSEDAQQGFH